MAGNTRSGLDGSAVLQELRNSGSPEAVIADLGWQSSCQRPSLHHLQRRPATESLLGDLIPVAATTAGEEKGRFLLFTEPSSYQVRIQELLGLMVYRHDVVATAFFMQPKVGPLSLIMVVLNLHPNNRRYPGKTECHDARQRPISQSNQARFRHPILKYSASSVSYRRVSTLWHYTSVTYDWPGLSFSLSGYRVASP